MPDEPSIPQQKAVGAREEIRSYIRWRTNQIGRALVRKGEQLAKRGLEEVGAALQEAGKSAEKGKVVAAEDQAETALAINNKEGDNLSAEDVAYIDGQIQALESIRLRDRRKNG